MKKSLYLVILLMPAIAGFSRDNSVKKNFTDHVSANRDSLKIIPSLDQMVLDITTAIGIQDNFELKSAEVLNIEASIIHKKRMILYNPVFMDWINKAMRNKWGAYALLAHEIGHHLNGHTMKNTGSQPELELEADEFAGSVLQKLGATLEEAQQVMIYISDNKGSKTHPCRSNRMEAIERGWNKSAAALSSR